MTDSLPASLSDAALAVLGCAQAEDKATLSRQMAAAWRAGRLPVVGVARPPERPARPARPELRPPREMPRRRDGRSPAARAALLHALAHIELNAIDLAWDMVARFAADGLPRAFFDDWVTVADDEARHFRLLADRLADFGLAYGDLPAHDGLWEAAAGTGHDLLARLAVVPMVLEARGLDVTPDMIERMRRFGDERSAGILETIYADEIGHVAAGCRWFDWLCARRGIDPRTAWQDLVRRHFRGVLKPPFNAEARAAAGLPSGFYRPIAAEPSKA
ncbi:MAG: ferritin-like domain-containing protein [Alphaproteobacteria bacterium]|nr:ferritin-like domain-containing protein [Alphaproteobacteria bacterium]